MKITGLHQMILELHISMTDLPEIIGLDSLITTQIA